MDKFLLETVERFRRNVVGRREKMERFRIGPISRPKSERT